MNEEKINEFLESQESVLGIIGRLRQALFYAIELQSKLVKKGEITEKEKEEIIKTASSYAIAFVGLLYHDYFHENWDEETRQGFWYLVVGKVLDEYAEKNK